MTDRDLNLRIRLELRRVAHGLDLHEALDAIMDHIRSRAQNDRNAAREGRTLH